jgi:exonuclease-1
MGIPGLLEQLKSISQNVHISQYKGKKVAIDAQCWLHRGAYSCSKELATGQETTGYISFFLSMVKMLKENGVDSIIAVFDGIPLPCKAETNFKRSSSRSEQRQLAKLADDRGDSKVAQAHYQRSVDITFDMVHRLITALDTVGVHYMIAPYEADAQLAYLSQNNVVDLVITEDSDLIAYGCHTVLFKLDKDGNGTAIEKEHLRLSQPLSFAGWTDDQFILFCCLAGCDYLPSLRNIGIKSAHKIVSAHKTLSRVLDHLAFSPAVQEFGGSFAARLQMAVMTFKHQTVFNPFTAQTEPLHPLPPHAGSAFTVSAQSSVHLPGGISGTVSRATSALQAQNSEDAAAETALDFLGPMLDAETAEQLVVGRVDPRTLSASNMSTTLPSATGVSPDPALLSAREEEKSSTPGAVPVDAEEGFQLFLSDDRRDDGTDQPPRTPPRGAGGGGGAPAGQHRIVWTSPSDRLHGTASTRDATTARQSDLQARVAPKRDSTGRPARVGRTAARGAASSTSHASATHASLQFTSALLSKDLQPLHRRVRPRLSVPLLPQRSQDYGQGSFTDEADEFDDAANDTGVGHFGVSATRQQTPFFEGQDKPGDSPAQFLARDGELMASYMDDSFGADQYSPALSSPDAVQDTPWAENGLAKFQDERFLAGAQGSYFLTATGRTTPVHSTVMAQDVRPAGGFHCAAPPTPWLWSPMPRMEVGIDRFAASGTGQEDFWWLTSCPPAGNLPWSGEPFLSAPQAAMPMVQYEETLYARRCF